MRRTRASVWKGHSLGLTVAVVLLLAVGVAFVYSACYVSDDQPVRGLYKKQMVWAVAGLGVYAALAGTDYRKLRPLAPWFYLGTLVLLGVVLIGGRRVSGARRWLPLMGDLNVQPSELAKLTMIIVLAVYLSRPGRRPLGGWTVLVVTLLTVPVVFLVVLEPDLGTAIVFVPLVLTMLYASGLPLRWMAVIVGMGGAAALYVLGMLYLPAYLGASEPTQQACRRWTGLSSYQVSRIDVFFSRKQDPLGASWNKIQSQIAIGSGGLRGRGFCKGTQNMLGFLPRSVSPTDFIFSVIAEETGFMGSMGLLGLYAVLLGGCFRAALRAGDRLGRLLCVGVAVMIFAHVFINIAMTAGLLPITGLPLPLLSYGGSFMLVTLAGLGLVQSVTIRSPRRPSGW